jgi:hypothetical protein
MRKRLRLFAIILLFFNGLGAMWGGVGLMYDPTGEFMQMPLQLIKHAPFKDYLIPGIILFIFNGLLSIYIAIVTILKTRYYPVLIIFQGIVLIIWLTTQIIMIRIFYAPLHLPFYLIAGFLVVIGVLLSKYDKL